MKPLTLKCCILLISVSAICGCSTSSSTFLFKDEFNLNWLNIKHLKGTPITLRVPTHVKVYVYEKKFLQAVTAGGVKEIKFIETATPMRDFAQDFIYTEKIFTVDFKRPAAGTLNLQVDYTADQYIDSVKQDITDETIARTGEFFQRLGASGLIQTSANAGKNVEENIKEVKSVIAVGVFEIDAPDFETQVMDFLNIHLNVSCDQPNCKYSGGAQQASNDFIDESSQKERFLPVFNTVPASGKTSLP